MYGFFLLKSYKLFWNLWEEKLSPFPSPPSALFSRPLYTHRIRMTKREERKGTRLFPVINTTYPEQNKTGRDGEKIIGMEGLVNSHTELLQSPFDNTD